MATTFSDEIAFAVVEQQGGVVGHKKRREVVLGKVEDAVVIKYSADSVICLLDPTQRVDNQLLLPARISGRFRVLGAGPLPFLDSHLGRKVFVRFRINLYHLKISLFHNSHNAYHWKGAHGFDGFVSEGTGGVT